MIPVYIAGRFGMLHPAQGTRGVLICGTLGDEALNVHRPLAILADQFAKAGSPTLRLEYYAMGDSAGEDSEPGRFQAWLDGIAAGVDWLRQTCGVGPVTLVGVRIGAAFCAQAACGLADIEALILVAPVATGRRYMRELILLGNSTGEIRPAGDPAKADQFEAYGLRLDTAARDALQRVDMTRLEQPPAAHALILDRGESRTAATLAESLRRLGTQVTNQPVDGLEGMLRDPFENTVPHDAFKRAVAWHAELCNGASANRQSFAVSSVIREIADDVLPICMGEERPIRLGSQRSLFGILSIPARPLHNAPSVLIANTGGNPRPGNSRIAVSLARWLAANGIASLRMDCAGSGDSAIETGDRGEPYSAGAERDLSTGVDELSRLFAAPVLILGICSGAFQALNLSAKDRRITGLMLVNLQKFVWKEGDSYRITQIQSRHWVDPSVWRKVVRGEIDILAVSLELGERVLRRLLAAADPVRTLWRRGETNVARVREEFRRLRERNLPILFAFSGNDPGLYEIAEYFGPRGRRLRRLPNVMFQLLTGADHTFSAHSARQQLRDTIATFLRQRCGLSIANVSLRGLALLTMGSLVQIRLLIS